MEREKGALTLFKVGRMVGRGVISPIANGISAPCKAALFVMLVRPSLSTNPRLQLAMPRHPKARGGGRGRSATRRPTSPTDH